LFFSSLSVSRVAKGECMYGNSLYGNTKQMSPRFPGRERKSSGAHWNKSLDRFRFFTFSLTF